MTLRKVITSSLAIVLSVSAATRAQTGYYDIAGKTDDDLLADGRPFGFWEKRNTGLPTDLPRRDRTGSVYHVAQSNPAAADTNPGTESLPFRSISQAAGVLQPGDRVIIHGGVYRETVHPSRGGTGPEKMITYEAAPGDTVVISGSVLLEGWERGEGWNYRRGSRYPQDGGDDRGGGDRQGGGAPQGGGDPVTVWQVDLPGQLMGGYNPFGMVNMLHDRAYLQYQKVKMDGHFRRRGMVFVDGKPLEQVEHPVDVAEKESGAFWVEHNGMRIHVRFPGKGRPDQHRVEAAIREQLFVPREYGTGYIRIRGIIFRHCANGFPVPQRGAVSSNRGNHWIIEGCTVEWVNALGIDLGNEMWNTPDQPGLGNHIVRGNVIRQCGIGGLQAMHAPSLLIEDNLFEEIGWQDAEHAWESGAIKLHRASDCLIRRNIFRKITHAPGIWLDYKSNRNCRITRNVFTDITTARGAIYIEVSRNHCLVDHNIFHRLRSQYWISGEYGAGGSALYTDGSDSIEFRNNLAFDIENTGYGSYLNAERMVDMRGGLTRFHRVEHNVFIDCRKHAIEFPNEYNYSDLNVFASMRPGYLKMANPAPALLLDLEAWRIAFGCEPGGRLARMAATLDPETLLFSLEVRDPMDLAGLHAGPFGALTTCRDVVLDPRKR